MCHKMQIRLDHSLVHPPACASHNAQLRHLLPSFSCHSFLRPSRFPSFPLISLSFPHFPFISSSFPFFPNHLPLLSFYFFDCLPFPSVSLSFPFISLSCPLISLSSPLLLFYRPSSPVHLPSLCHNVPISCPAFRAPFISQLVPFHPLKPTSPYIFPRFQFIFLRCLCSSFALQGLALPYALFHFHFPFIPVMSLSFFISLHSLYSLRFLSNPLHFPLLSFHFLVFPSPSFPFMLLSFFLRLPFPPLHSP